MAQEGLKAGHHQLMIKATPKAGGETIQQTMALMIKEQSSGEYDFVFPQSLKSYTAGTKVQQPKNGKVYQCKPFPYSGYCVQWATTATQLEASVGPHWQEDWIELN